METQDIKNMGLAYLQVLEASKAVKEDAAITNEEAEFDEAQIMLEGAIDLAKRIIKRGVGTVTGSRAKAHAELADMIRHKSVSNIFSMGINKADKKGRAAQMKKSENEIRAHIKKHDLGPLTKKPGEVTAHRESVDEAKKMSISGKQIKAALASAKAQAKPKDQVSLKKAPFDIPKESFDVDSLLAIFENLEESQIDLILANLDEQQLDEISNKTIDSYRKKAYGQYKTSADKASDGPWGSAKPETRAKHAARYAKRHKGIGSADKRTMARDPDNFKFGRIGKDGHDPKNDSMSSKTVGDMRKIKGYSNKKESVVYEAMSNNVLDRLISGEGASHHMGHDGAAQQHHYAAEEARNDGNTKAAAHHERASAHHERASEHLEAGNHIMADHNSERAAHHAKLAVKHGGEETDSHEVHQDHSKAHRLDSAGYTAESTERNWTVLNRILEKAIAPRDMNHVKGATPPEAMDSKASPKAKEFAATSGVPATPVLDADVIAQQTIDAIRASAAKISGNSNRPNDQKNGDKNIIKSTVAESSALARLKYFLKR
jgi:hypothetical protein